MSTTEHSDTDGRQLEPTCTGLPSDARIRSPGLLEQPVSRRRLLAAAGAGGSLLLLRAVPGAASAAEMHRRPSRDSIVVQWNQAFMQAVRESTVGPPAISRALAIGHTCIFDAWAAYDDRAVGTRLGGSLRRRRAECSVSNMTQAISFAAYRAAVDLLPAGRASIFDPLMARLGYDGSDQSTDTSTPTGIGNVVAQAVLAFRHRDGANQLGDEPGGIPGVPYSDYTGYMPANDPMDIRLPFDPAAVRDPNSWQPLRYVDLSGTLVTPRFLGAQWQHVTPFAFSPTSRLRSPSGPARYGSAEFLAQAQAVLALSADLTDEQKVIAEYWADGPNSELPPGHWACLRSSSPAGTGMATGARHQEGRHPLLRAHQCRLRLRVLRLGCQGGVQFGAADHGYPLPLPRAVGTRLGGSGSGHENDRRRNVVPVPTDDLPHSPLWRVHVRTQQLQRRRSRGSEASPAAIISVGRRQSQPGARGSSPERSPRPP